MHRSDPSERSFIVTENGASPGAVFVCRHLCERLASASRDGAAAVVPPPGESGHAGLAIVHPPEIA